MLFECKKCTRVSSSPIEEMLNETNTYYLVSVRCDYCAYLQRKQVKKPKGKTDSGDKNQNEAPKPKKDKEESK